MCCSYCCSKFNAIQRYLSNHGDSHISFGKVIMIMMIMLMMKMMDDDDNDEEE